MPATGWSGLAQSRRSREPRAAVSYRGRSIGGLGTNVEVGATAFVTHVSTQDFCLRTIGASVDVDNRVEISAARQRFDAASVIPGLTLGQDIFGLKVRLAGDAVFASDTWLPQVAAGALWKRTLDFDGIPRAVGAAHGADIDFYLAATKVYFAAILRTQRHRRRDVAPDPGQSDSACSASAAIGPAEATS